MIQIVDVHEQTTMIEVRILCTPRLDPWATQLAASAVCSTAGCQIQCCPTGSLQFQDRFSVL